MNMLGWAMLSKGSEAMEITQMNWKVTDYVEGVRKREESLNSFLVVYCISLGWETDMLMHVNVFGMRMLIVPWL